MSEKTLLYTNNAAFRIWYFLLKKVILFRLLQRHQLETQGIQEPLNLERKTGVVDKEQFFF
jgi:hypothetical protein